MRIKLYPNEDGFGPYTGIYHVVKGLLAEDPTIEIVVQGGKNFLWTSSMKKKYSKGEWKYLKKTTYSDWQRWNAALT